MVLRNKSTPRIKIFLDSASLDEIGQWASDPQITGFTTNPSLMSRAGISNYRDFAGRVLQLTRGLPVSMEVLSDNLKIMEDQALTISLWSNSIYVKIPITTTTGESTLGLVRTLGEHGVKVNITAVLSWRQVCDIREAAPSGPTIVSIFAGRIADTGINPVTMVTQAVKLLSALPNIEVLWASPRRVLDIFDASDAGASIITCTPDILKKIGLLGKDLDEYSLETVRQFHNDGQQVVFG